jgi:uroporphyrinogen decarboxylase
MNGYERIKAALDGQPHDRIPVMLHNFMVAAKEANMSMRQFREDPRIIADVFIRATEKYGCDGILVDVDTVTLAGSLGVPVDFPEDEPARQLAPLLESMEDVQMLKLIKVENYKYIMIWLEAVRLLKEHFGNEVFVRGNCDQAPFSLASMVRGSTSLMMDLCTAMPEQIETLLNYCTEASCQFIRLMAQTGADMVSNGDSVAGPAMISPDFYEQFALPYEKKVIEEAHRHGVPYALHICGNTDLILELMVESGADAFEIDYKTDIHRAFELLHDRATFIGNIDPSGVIALGSPKLVEAKTTELLNVFGKTNRFILNAGCAIPSNAPEANIRMLVETARNYQVF